jgi:dolichol kinase
VNSAQSEACTVKASSSSSNAAGARDGKRNTPVSPSFWGKEEFGYLWMSVPKNYRCVVHGYHLELGSDVGFLGRESSDDGILTGLMLILLISVALLYAVLEQAQQISHPLSPTPRSWLIEPPMYLSSHPNFLTPLQALVLARYSLVNLATLCSMILLFSVYASSWAEARFRYRVKCNAPDEERSFDGERGSVPRSEAKRSLFYVLLTLGVTACSLCLKHGLNSVGIPIWQRRSFVFHKTKKFISKYRFDLLRSWG